MTSKELTQKEAREFDELKTLLESAEFALRRAERIAVKNIYTVKFFYLVLTAHYKTIDAKREVDFVNTGGVLSGGKRI